MIQFWVKPTFCWTCSSFDLNLLPLFPVQPVENSGPSEVSAMKECLVPRLDSKMNPARSSPQDCSLLLWNKQNIIDNK